MKIQYRVTEIKAKYFNRIQSALLDVYEDADSRMYHAQDLVEDCLAEIKKFKDKRKKSLKEVV